MRLRELVLHLKMQHEGQYCTKKGKYMSVLDEV